MRSIALLMAFSSTATADCPRTTGSTILTTTDDVIAAGGGVILAQGVPATGPVHFRQAGVERAPTVRVIAPGLEVYELPPAGDPDLEFLDDGGTSLGVVHRGPATPLLPSPHAKRLVWEASDPAHTTEMEWYGNLGPGSETVTAMLEGNVPDDALALVVSRMDRKGNAVPAAWGLAPYASDQVYAVTRSCRTPGRIAPGDRVVLAWLDRSGRLGAASKPIVVGR
jgi:hypothetical protein